jgi:hypothetical protein
MLRDVREPLVDCTRVSESDLAPRGNPWMVWQDNGIGHSGWGSVPGSADLMTTSRVQCVSDDREPPFEAMAQAGHPSPDVTAIYYDRQLRPAAAGRRSSVVAALRKRGKPGRGSERAAGGVAMKMWICTTSRAEVVQNSYNFWRLISCKLLRNLVGLPRFEVGTSCTPKQLRPIPPGRLTNVGRTPIRLVKPGKNVKLSRRSINGAFPAGLRWAMDGTGQAGGSEQEVEVGAGFAGAGAKDQGSGTRRPAIAATSSRRRRPADTPTPTGGAFAAPLAGDHRQPDGHVPTEPPEADEDEG